MDTRVGAQKKSIGVIILSLFLLLFSSSLVYGQWDSIDTATIVSSSDWAFGGVHFTSATEGWAVGSDYQNGKVILLHYSGGKWTSVTPPPVSSNWELLGVHFTSPGNGWAVGGDYANHIGVLLHYSRGKWTSVTPPPVSSNWYLTGVHFTLPTEGWAVGHDNTNGNGVLLHFSKKKWTSVTPPPVSLTWHLEGVHLTSATEGWAVGVSNDGVGVIKGVLLHYSGGTWTSATPPSISSKWWFLRAVHFTSATEGWAVGHDNTNGKGVLLHYSGGTWTSVTPLSLSLNWLVLSGVHFTSAAEGWVVGCSTDGVSVKGVLLHYSGGTWTSVAPPSFGSDWELSRVHFTLPNEGWATGYDYNNRGILLHFSFWPLASSSKLMMKGWAKASDLFYGTCHIESDGTFYLSQIDHGPFRTYTGTYVMTPDGKSIQFTFDAGGLSAMKAMLMWWVKDLAVEEGVNVQNISFSFDLVSISQGKISKKTNAPSNLTIKIAGTVSASFDGVDRTMTFTYQSNPKYYSP